MAGSGNGHIKMVDAGCEMAFRTLEVLAYVQSKKKVESRQLFPVKRSRFWGQGSGF